MEDEISEKPEIISMHNHTIMEEPSNEASEQSSERNTPKIKKTPNNKDYSTDYQLKMGASIS